MESGAAESLTVPKDLKQQLSLAVRSIDWSYGIFWSISPSQPGVLEWGDGYYNGEIKTRKTVQAVEFDADELGLQRSEQLRELFESLSAGESSGQIRRPSAALSPEDLTDTEWYYLVCMSFHFDIGQGLPGRTLLTGQSIWLFDAQCADTKIFSRSLLAKVGPLNWMVFLLPRISGLDSVSDVLSAVGFDPQSAGNDRLPQSASIQTVVCFPFLGGAIELGVTDLVPEDPALIQHVKASLLDTPHLRSSMKFHHEVFETKMIPIVGELELVSPTTSSNGFEAYQLPAETPMVGGLNVAASQALSGQFIDDDLSNCLRHSVDSSDCISQTFIDSGNATQVFLSENEGKGDCKDELGLDVRGDDVHYQSVVSSLLKTSKEFIFWPNLENFKRESSFRRWKNGGSADCDKQSYGTQQRMLKRVLFGVPRMHDMGLTEFPIESCGDKNGVWKPEADEIGINHVLMERRRREKIKERFCTLKSIIPSIDKVDKVSILDDTIEYLKTLERRVEELECEESEEMLRKDTSEKTCDNYGESNLGMGKRPSASKRPSSNKRKAREIDETEIEINYDNNLLVSIVDKEVVIEMKCRWREGLLLEIINKASNLRLDSHSVQSSTADGILSLAMKSKFVGSASPSARTIRQAMQRFALKRP